MKLNNKNIIEQKDGLDYFMADLSKAEKEREQFEV
jgi:hypothetical protein